VVPLCRAADSGSGAAGGPRVELALSNRGRVEKDLATIG
jgi:hypothetical protein